jgi:peptide chain release factor subunit 1
MAKEFYRRIADSVKEIFFEMPRLKGLFIGGPGPTKDEFITDGNIPNDLKKKIIAVKDVTYTDEQGLSFLVDVSQEDIASEEITKEKIILKEFFETLGKNPSKVAYEINAVKRALEMGAVQKLIISTKIPKEIAKELAKKAESIAAEVYYVSDETNEGVQFKNISGIGALLRFVI